MGVLVNTASALMLVCRKEKKNGASLREQHVFFLLNAVPVMEKKKAKIH